MKAEIKLIDNRRYYIEVNAENPMKALAIEGLRMKMDAEISVTVIGLGNFYLRSLNVK